jgi:hypothetical protein
MSVISANWSRSSSDDSFAMSAFSFRVVHAGHSGGSIAMPDRMGMGGRVQTSAGISSAGVSSAGDAAASPCPSATFCRRASIVRTAWDSGAANR